MAGDWLQIDLDLPEKPEVLAIAQHVRKTSAECPLEIVIGRLMLFWRWVERHASCELVRGADAQIISRLCGGDEGFWRAVEAQGWVSFTEEGIVIPGWETRFSKSAKRRTLDARRKKHVRKTSAKRPQASGQMSAKCPQTTGPKEEKNREEDIFKGVNPLKPPAGEIEGAPVGDDFSQPPPRAMNRTRPEMIPVPTSLETPEFRAQWSLWTAYFLQLQPTTPQLTFQEQLVNLARWGPAKAIRSMQASIANGWKKLGDPDERNAGHGGNSSQSRSAPRVGPGQKFQPGG